MYAIMGTIRNGQVLLDAAAPWPEGKRVKVNEVDQTDSDSMMMTEAEWRTDPEGIREWLEWYNGIDPVIQSDEEIAFIEKEIREFGKHSLITDQKLEDFMP